MQCTIPICLRRALGALALCAALAPAARAADLTVYAAASLGGALDEVALAWAEATGGALRLVFAGSSALARQVQAGAPADVVILANTAWMDALVASGDIAGTPVDVLGNRLVVIGPSDAAPLDLAALPARLGEDRLALALVEAVPAGLYARAALDHVALWDAVAPRVVQTDNVRAALALVAARAAAFGIVYATDAAAEPRVAIVADIPQDAHPPIRYPAAITARAGPGADALLGFLNGPDAQAIFAHHGFLPPPEAQ